MTLTEKLLHFVSFDTASDPTSNTCPTTKGQLVFGEELVRMLKEIGLEDANMDENGYVFATLPSNIDKKVPTVGFLAHNDTIPELPGYGIKPRVIENYDGNDILLNEEKNIIMKVKEFPSLAKVKGHDLIVTDGTSLLGADDKAGIAEIMTAVEELLKEGTPHGDVRVAFTPDEEIGRGPWKFDVPRFNADFAYTVDGGAEGQVQFECFNAAQAVISVHGFNIHPGSSKNKMRNAILMGMEYNSLLPAHEIPFCTEGYEGFYHLMDITGGVEETKLTYIIRDHSAAKFEQKLEMLKKAADYLNSKYGENTIEVSITEQYRNMREVVEPKIEIIDLAYQAMRDAGMEPYTEPIRGGTDGAQLSFKGLPCPNLSTGGDNAHGTFEYCSINSMRKMTDCIKNIIVAVASK